jgi:hypothetical protein
MNRFQLNFKRNVGAVSEEIRKCAPKSIHDWEQYYFSIVRSKDEIEQLGKKLYVKISEVIIAEIEQVNEDDCISYMFEMVINRTFDGYQTEIATIYGQLREILQVDIEPAPDEWDRLYYVVFFIKIQGRYIGLQIKPVSQVSHIPQIYKEKSIQQRTHLKFTEKFGGGVFYVISIKEGNKKTIKNTEIIEEISKEIQRLTEMPL